MQEQQYYALDYLLRAICEPNGSICQKILADNRKLFQAVPGSGHNHQAWPGGYIDHVTEVMNIANQLYGRMDSLRRLPFSISDLLLILFLHDLEKPWKYEIVGGKLQYKPGLKDKAAQQQFRMEKLKEYGIILTPNQENGLKYAEGELQDYSKERRVMSPLAAMAHMCDVASARIWFNFPLFRESDSWVGAERFRD